MNQNRVRRNRNGLTVLEMLAMVGIIVTLILSLVPAVQTARHKRQVRQVLANGQAIWNAMNALNATRAAAGQPPAWPGTNYASSTQFFIEYSATNLLGSRFAFPMLSAPGVPAWTNVLPGKITSSNNAWCVTLNVTTSTPPVTPFLFTANFRTKAAKKTVYEVAGLEPKAVPFGDRLGVVVTVGGNVKVFRKEDVDDDFNLIFNPESMTNQFARP